MYAILSITPGHLREVTFHGECPGVFTRDMRYMILVMRMCRSWGGYTYGSLSGLGGDPRD